MTPAPRRLAPLAFALAGLALLPLASLAADWLEYRRNVGLPLVETPATGFDGVRWADGPAGVRAAYVLPRSSAGRAGVREGDRLVTIDLMPIDSAAVAERQVERATGTVLTYRLTRGRAAGDAQVRIDRYPTFLYPLDGLLWAATGWGFGLVAFVHLLAYLTVAPLARRSTRARRARRLIGAAFVWVGVNLVRWLWVSVFGPPPSGSTVEGAVFDALTLVALVGWTAYPALLLDQALRTRAAVVALGRWRWVLAVPPVLLGLGVSLASLLGHVGPLPPDGFTVPILFYACVYVAAWAALGVVRPPSGQMWVRIASAAVGLLAVAGAAVALGRLGPGPREGEVLTAGFVVGFQLLSLLPVALVSTATLRYGAFDAILLDTLATVATLAAAFGVVVFGSAFLDAVLPGGSQPVALGVLVVALLLAAERAAPALRATIRTAFETQRQRARARLDRFVDRIRQILDPETLAEEAVEVVGRALDVRSAVLFLQASDNGWVRATFRPEPPSFTRTDLDHIWQRIRDDGRVWSRNEELNDADLPRDMAARLGDLGVALAIPVTSGRGEPVGLLALGRKARRLSVYDTEDVALLRALAAQLALAVERLRLIDRERALIRQTSEAEMAALRAQINPHFLFNALNTVAALIRDRPDAAESTVEDLAGLFRDVLTASGETMVPLRDELRLVSRYLRIEQARFGESLSVEVDADDEALGVPIPAFSVQTLVENAVKHGVERKRGGGSVTVRARHAADHLHVEVADTGAGLLLEGATFGVGLSNVADRLHLLYGDAATLIVEPADPGAVATLRLPLMP